MLLADSYTLRAAEAVGTSIDERQGKLAGADATSGFDAYRIGQYVAHQLYGG